VIQPLYGTFIPRLRIVTAQDYSSDNPVKVIVTFLEEIHYQSDKGLSLSEFSFSRSQKNLENFKGSLSDIVIEERGLNYENIFRYHFFIQTLSSCGLHGGY
jgi:hypothetical protein